MPSTNHRKKFHDRASEQLRDTRLDVLKNRFISNYFMLVASSSPIKFSKIVFRVWNFVQSLTEVAVQKQFLSVVANHSKSDFFFTVNWMAESEDIRQVYSTEFLLNTATITEVKLGDFLLLKIVRWEKHRIVRYYSARLQTTTQSLRTAKMKIHNWIYTVTFPAI